jgi:hypothetical protein
MQTALPVQLYQPDEKDAAGTWLHEQKRQGLVAAVFLYANPSGVSEHCWGTLFACMPMNTGITLACHEALKKNYHIQVFVQGEQVGVWLKDSDIEAACSLLAGGILPSGRK